MFNSLLSSQELIQQCTATGGSAAWEEFVRRFHRLIAGVALRTARRWAEPASGLIDDLIQETYLKLCANRDRLQRDLAGRQDEQIFGYIKVVTANVVHDHFKALHAEKRGSGEEAEDVSASETSGSHPARNSEEELERSILLREIDACLLSLGEGATAERDRTIFWLYYRQGLTASAIAALPSMGLSTKGVESTIHRLTCLVRSKMVEEQLARQGASRQTSTKGFEPAKSL